MEAVRRPRFKVVYEGRDISQDIEKYLTSVEYIDNTASESDEVSFTVEDTFANWRGSWFPFKGDKIELSIGYDNNLLFCGTFTVDEIEMQGPPDTVTIRALAAGINSPLRTKNSKAYEGQSLRQIAEEVARKYGYTIIDGETTRLTRKISFESERKTLTKVYGDVLSATKILQYSAIAAELSSTADTIEDKGKSEAAKPLRAMSGAIAKAKSIIKDAGSAAEIVVIKNLRVAVVKTIKSVKPELVDYISTTVKKNSVLDGIRVDRVTQNEEHDLEFLKRLAGDYGVLFSLRNDQLIFTSIYTVESGSSVRTLDRTELISYTLKEKATKVYRKAIVKHHNPKQNKVIKAEIEANAQAANNASLRINSEHVSSQDDLIIYARVENLQQAEEKARAALHLANSKHQEGSVSVPGNPLLVAGNNFDLTSMGSLSGKYHITRSSHRVGRDGYVTDLEIKRIGEVTNLGTKFTTQGEVLFDFDKSEIRPAGYVEIERILAFMTANPESVIEVGGHTDSVASGEYNQSLSDRRANAVRDYMISKGILATRLVAKGYGEIKPVASNSTPEGRQKNRRTEFIVIRNI